jgi:hypothetical protein
MTEESRIDLRQGNGFFSPPKLSARLWDPPDRMLSGYQVLFLQG